MTDTTTEMLTGQAAEEHDAGFVPFVDENVAAVEGEDLTEKEAADRLAALSSNGPVTTHMIGVDMPDNVTLTAEQGAKIVTDSRDADAAQAEIDADKALLAKTDAERPAKEESKPALSEEDEVERVLKMPRVKEALDRHVAEVETTKATYSKAVETANTFAQAAFIENFPEIARLPLDQWEGALRAMHSREPSRFNTAMGTLNRVAQLQNAAAQQQQQKAAVEAAEFRAYATTEDAKVIEMMKGESNMRAIEAHIPAMLKSLGVDPGEFVKAGNDSKFLRSAAAQAILVKAAKYDIAMKQQLKPSPRPLPPVNRPGVSTSRSERAASDLKALDNRLGKSGSFDDGVALLQASRKGKR